SPPATPSCEPTFRRRRGRGRWSKTRTSTCEKPDPATRTKTARQCRTVDTLRRRRTRVERDYPQEFSSESSKRPGGDSSPHIRRTTFPGRQRMRIYLLLAMAAGASFIGSNCGGAGIGDPCVPEDEYLTTFSGFSQDEVNVESRSFQCLTRVCLVNHFDGRVSCPYGQIEDPAAPNEGL